VTQAADELAAFVAGHVATLTAVDAVADGKAVQYRHGGRTFAIAHDRALEVDVGPDVAEAAIRTPDTTRSTQGPGWVAFTPGSLDRFAQDRARAWLDLAYRRVARDASG
jgi:hypothetical protein